MSMVQAVRCLRGFNAAVSCSNGALPVHLFRHLSQDVLFCHKAQHTDRQMDGQTDRQTDDSMIQIADHCMQYNRLKYKMAMIPRLRPIVNLLFASWMGAVSISVVDTSCAHTWVSIIQTITLHNKLYDMWQLFTQYTWKMIIIHAKNATLA